MNQKRLLVKDLGEHGLLKKLFSYCAPNLVGDDAAVLTTSPDKQLVVTTDVLVENVHFSERTTPPFSVGWRAVAANLSDLAAMGALPLGITVGLSLRGDVEVSWVESLYQGMKQCLDTYGGVILGGDLCRSSLVTIAITALGEVEPQKVIKRDTAKPGDVIMITGFHGLSRAGLELLLYPQLCPKLSPQAQEKLTLAHQQPKPRLDVIKLIQNLNLPSPLTGMDSSDGLADGIIQICRLSGVGAEIERNCLTQSPELLELASQEQVLEWILYGGEDFELVLCLPRKFAQQLVEKLGMGAAIIGTITKGEEITLVDSQGIDPKVLLTQSKGFQHF
jgi:thiamine-monophosphate kinase